MFRLANVRLNPATPCARFVLAAALSWAAANGVAAPPAQQTFATPEAGVDALIKAVKADDQPALQAMLGPDSDILISSGDTIEDAHSRRIFLHIYDVAHAVVYQDDSHAVLVIGRAKRPTPIPLIKDAGEWHFDTEHGRAQILQRRIERNELNAMQVCLAIVYAERQYAADHAGDDGAPVYTTHFHSRPGQHDGLYWPTAPNEPPSLLGVLVADAAVHDGYTPPGVSKVKPYHGYVYRIVTQPASEAGTGSTGHAGNLTVMAYPALYGASGIRSFFVGADGVVYGKDLGADTAAIVANTHGFHPAEGWKISRPVD